MQTLHASCVAVAGRGVLLEGPSGSGKSALALQLIALGADLVSDDLTVLHVEGGTVMASCPPAGRGLIEARGIGLLTMRHVAKCTVALVVDLSRNEVSRLPKVKTRVLLGTGLPRLHKVEAAYFPAAILAFLRGATLLEAE